MDGVGGMVKRLVWQQVKGRLVVMASAYDFYKCPKAGVTKIKIYVLAEDIDKNKEILQDCWSHLM